MNIPLNIDFNQIILHIFNFAILAGGLYFLLYKPVKEFMYKRSAYYEELEKTANDKLSHATTLESEYQTKIDEIETEIVQMKAKAVKETETLADSMLKSAKEQSCKMVQSAKESAEQERSRMLSEAREQIAQIAVEATRKLLEENSSKIYDEFLTAAAKEQDVE